MLREQFNKEFGLLLKQHRTLSQEEAQDITGINIFRKENGDGGVTFFNFISLCHCMGWSDVQILTIVRHLVKVYETGMAKQNWIRQKKGKRQKKGIGEKT